MSHEFDCVRSMTPITSICAPQKGQCGVQQSKPKMDGRSRREENRKRKKKSSSGAIQRVSHFLHAFVLPEADKAQKGSAVSGIAVWSRYVWVTYAMAGPRDSLAGGGSLSLFIFPRYIYIYIFITEILTRVNILSPRYS